MNAFERLVVIAAALACAGVANAVTPTASRTPTPVTTPTPLVLFHDDFSGDLAKWEVAAGTWDIVDGQLLGTGAGGGIDAWIYAGNVTWTDYAVELIYFGDAIANFAVRSTGHWTNEYRVDVCATANCSDRFYDFIKYHNGTQTVLGGGGFSPVRPTTGRPSESRSRAVSCDSSSTGALRTA